MFSVIYKFEIKADRKDSFESSWKDLTILFYEHAGSLGSRLLKKDASIYIAYAQWPNKETWKNSSNRLPESSNEIIDLMKGSCVSIETLYELELVEDLLKNKPHKDLV